MFIRRWFGPNRVVRYLEGVNPMKTQSTIDILPSGYCSSPFEKYINNSTVRYTINGCISPFHRDMYESTRLELEPLSTAPSTPVPIHSREAWVSKSWSIAKHVLICLFWLVALSKTRYVHSSLALFTHPSVCVHFASVVFAVSHQSVTTAFVFCKDYESGQTLTECTDDVVG